MGSGGSALDFASDGQARIPVPVEDRCGSSSLFCVGLSAHAPHCSVRAPAQRTAEQKKLMACLEHEKGTCQKGAACDYSHEQRDVDAYRKVKKDREKRQKEKEKEKEKKKGGGSQLVQPATVVGVATAMVGVTPAKGDAPVPAATYPGSTSWGSKVLRTWLRPWIPT